MLQGWNDKNILKGQARLKTVEIIEKKDPHLFKEMLQFIIKNIIEKHYSHLSDAEKQRMKATFAENS